MPHLYELVIYPPSINSCTSLLFPPSNEYYCNIIRSNLLARRGRPERATPIAFMIMIAGALLAFLLSLAVHTRAQHAQRTQPAAVDVIIIISSSRKHGDDDENKERRVAKSVVFAQPNDEKKSARHLKCFSFLRRCCLYEPLLLARSACALPALCLGCAPSS